MNRRAFLMGSAAATAVLGQTRPGVLKNLGGAPAGFPIRIRQARDAGKPFDFVDHCHNLGLGVVETRLDSGDPAAAIALRRKAESYGMRVILDAKLPKEQGDLAAFDAAMRMASEAGAVGLRCALTGRRYEVYQTLEAYKKDFEQHQKSVGLAEPILRKHRVRLGLENHKGWRSAEQAAWLKRVSSEWVGVHFDFGNNMALCEMPMQALENLKPYTFSSHIKDMAVAPYTDGFLLSEVPLGEGLLDLKAMVKSLQARNPNMAFSLEMITRDPLRVPAITKPYWATFDDAYSPLPGRELAAMLEMAQHNRLKSALPTTSGLSPEAQLKLEDECIAKSIEWARRNLPVG